MAKDIKFNIDARDELKKWNWLMHFRIPVHSW